MKPLKVYGTSVGSKRRIVAARTKTEAAKAFGISGYEFNLYAAETGNEPEIAVATRCPGQCYERPLDDRDAEWERA